MRDDIKERIEKIKRGEVPAGYKKTNIAIIPKEWEVSLFSSVASVQGGLVDPKEEPYASMFHIGSENIERDTGRISKIKQASDQKLISGKYIFDDNSIIYSKVRPNLNKVCIPEFKGICSADCYAVKVNALILKDYLYNYMLSIYFLKQVISCSMRTKMPKINKAELGAIRVLVPSFDEQKNIIKYLRIHDRNISINKELIYETNEKKKWLMQSLLTGRKRLQGFENGWKKQKMQSLFSERIEIDVKDSVLLSVTANGIVPRTKVKGKDISSNDKSKYKKIYSGDIGYNTMRMWQGISAYSQYEGIVSPAYTVLNPKEGVDAKFFAYLFKLPESISMFYRYSQGLVDDTRNLKYSNFKKIKLYIPAEIKEQKAIAKILSTADKEIELLEKKLELLKLEKKAMMQLLLTGIVRVNDH